MVTKIIVPTSNYDCCNRYTVGVDQWVCPTEYIVAGLDNEGGVNCRMHSGIRFPNVRVPSGATIRHAYLLLCPFQTSPLEPLPENCYRTVNTRIQAQASDDASPFSTKEDYDARPRTTAYVDWNDIPVWPQDYVFEKERKSSPDIACVIQEVVSRPGWKKGNAIVIFWSDNGSVGTDPPDNPYPWRNAYPYYVWEYGGYPVEYAPQLYIEFDVIGSVEPMRDPNEERWRHLKIWNSGEVTISSPGVSGQQNLGSAVPSGKKRRITELTIRHTGTNNTTVTLLVSGGDTKLTIDVPAQTTRVWSSQDGRVFNAGEQPAVQSSDTTGGPTYVSASGVEA
jgi:hypothetical protein